jgi:hypothetical protein
MRVGNFPTAKTILCVRVNKLQCTLWSCHSAPHNGRISLDAAGVRMSRPTSEGGYPGIWVDRGWRGVMVGIEGVDFTGDQP